MTVKVRLLPLMRHTELGSVLRPLGDITGVTSSAQTRARQSDRLGAPEIASRKTFNDILSDVIRKVMHKLFQERRRV